VALSGSRVGSGSSHWLQQLVSAWGGERYSTSGGRAHSVLALKLEIGAQNLLSVILQLIVFIAVNFSFLD